MDVSGPKFFPPPGPLVERGRPGRTLEGRTVHRSRAPAAKEVSAKRALALVGATLAQQQKTGPADAVKAAIGSLDAPAVQGLIQKGDDLRPTIDGLSKAPWAKSLRKQELGGPTPISAMAIRPGQTQLSYDHAAIKMQEIAEGILEREPRSLAEIFDPDDFPVVIGPEGGFALLRDGHHKLAGLLALSTLVHEVLGTGSPASSHTALNLGKSWKKLAEVIPPPDRLEVPAWVAGQESKVSRDQQEPTRVADFFSLFDDPDRYKPPLYLQYRGGGKASVPPEKMSDLDDNPFRRLAAELVTKFKWDEEGMPKFKSAEQPLWLKGPSAPDYVEFHIAEVLAQTAGRMGFEYRAHTPVPDDVRDAFRKALLEAQHHGHPVLQQVITFEHETNWDKLRTSLELLPHAVMDFDRGPSLEDDEVPIILLPSEAPDVHRLHAAARLHDALTSAGAGLTEQAITPDVARSAIKRLAAVDDDVGLWINTRGLTKGQLDRNAKLASRLGLSVEPKKTKVVLSERPEVGRPLWVDVPGLPESTPHVLGDLWGKLLETIGHDPKRFPEILDQARSQLIAAKTNPQHPLYERVAQIPVVVSGDAESIAASLRVGRKKNTLDVGRPVDNAKETPHVLGPRTHLRVKSS